MATYVLVHGGGHGGWCYQPLARIMRSQGQEVYTPTLTGLGEREHLLSLAPTGDVLVASRDAPPAFAPIPPDGASPGGHKGGAAS